jgi:hypothetical protein
MTTSKEHSLNLIKELCMENSISSGTICMKQLLKDYGFENPHILTFEESKPQNL